MKMNSTIREKKIRKKCINGRIIQYLCMNINCENEHPYMCNEISCSCQNNHRECVHSTVKSFMNAVELTAIPLEQIKEKINEIFDNIIGGLSEKREKILENYNDLFLDKIYSSKERLFVESFEEENNLNITGKFLSEIYENLYKRDEINNWVTNLTYRLNNLEKEMKEKEKNLDKEIRKVLNTFYKNMFRESKKVNKFYFKASNLIENRKEEIKMIDLLPIEMNECKLIFKGSREEKFSNEEFHKKCDNIEKVLIFLKTNFNQVIGGYSPLKFVPGLQRIWDLDRTKSTFLLSLTKGDKFKLSEHSGEFLYSYSSNHEENYLWNFNDELFIANFSQNSNSKYEFKDGYNNWKYSLNKDGCKIFTGSPNENFLITECEVWKLTE